MTTLQKIEDLIYKGFKETDTRLAEYRRKLEKETAAHRRKLEKENLAHRRKIEEEALAHHRKIEEETLAHRREIDARMERSHRKTKQELDWIAKELGGVTQSLSRFSEQTVYPATKRLFSKRGIELNRLYANMQGHLNGHNMETDVLGLGPECVVLIEVKLRLRQDDVEEFLEKKLPRFFDYFPAYHRPVLYGGVAGLSIDKGVDRFAYKRGLFVIGQTGDNVRILNDRKFRPRSFAVAEDDRFSKIKVHEA